MAWEFDGILNCKCSKVYKTVCECVLRVRRERGGGGGGGGGAGRVEAGQDALAAARAPLPARHSHAALALPAYGTLTNHCYNITFYCNNLILLHFSVFGIT